LALSPQDTRESARMALAPRKTGRIKSLASPETMTAQRGTFTAVPDSRAAHGAHDLTRGHPRRTVAMP
jgi:hypothetical protein